VGGKEGPGVLARLRRLKAFGKNCNTAESRLRRPRRPSVAVSTMGLMVAVVPH
jgi:hypothetical protein